MKNKKHKKQNNERRAKAKARALQRRKARQGKQIIQDFSVRGGV